MFKFIFSKKLMIITMAGILYAGITNASVAASPELKDFFKENKALTLSLSRELPKAPPETREAIIINILNEPSASLFDLSLSNIGDNDIEAVFKGLTQRELRSSELKDGSVSIKLLDISQDHVTKKGIEKLLKLLQKGATVEGKEHKVFPDVRGTVMKVSSAVDFTEELLTQWQYIAPKVFSGGLRIVD